ncbi:hypothetical protein J2Z62_000099 [Mycoplasmoides fastidiosum]|uniref:Uncharacterized protein n=1 Tax=Mycoplasmoides fastidiosum TaxID=92758 RepID=A0ABU0LY80_9BACT|nr:hypothetical protein [Mycoplasmoides fastidiosum]MDQ0513661.1 hypothetical protein [Mycoplasmoides fastidiosum]UUD37919.1 hypothetical protein NPA10_00790 [Mycoplasmoides fastidiosum]
MNDNKKPLGDDEIIEDGLDLVGQEVTHKSDLELANLFIVHNNDALYNPEAAFTNIDTGVDEEAEATNLVTGIDEALRRKTLADVQKKQIVFKHLLAEDYRKKWVKAKWKQFTNLFNLENQTYKSKFNYQLETDDWKNYERTRIKRHRNSEIMHGDFLTYSDLQLRNNRSLRKIWSIEILITLLIFSLSVVFMALLSSVRQAFNLTDNSLIGSTLNSISTATYVFSALAIILLIVPYFFLFTSWFVVIKDVDKSRNFHYFMIMFLIFAGIFIVIATGLIITYYSYSFALWIPQ